MQKIALKNKILFFNYGDNMLELLRFPHEIAKDIAKQEKNKRKKRKLTQAELSARSGVSLASLKRFEQTGEISFVSLVKIAMVLDETDTLDQLFLTREYSSIQEVIDEKNKYYHMINFKIILNPCYFVTFL